MSLEAYAKERIRQVQNGEWPDRSVFPDRMKDAVFNYGMEYGYLLAMLDLIEHLSKKPTVAYIDLWNKNNETSSPQRHALTDEQLLELQRILKGEAS